MDDSITAPRKIVVFGSSGVGKSSLINALIGRDELSISDGAKGGTLFQTSVVEHERNGVLYQFIDVCGLNEADIGSAPDKLIVANLIQLAKRFVAGEMHLLIYVMAYRVTEITIANYKLFVNAMAKDKIPTVIVVTGCEKTKPSSAWAQRASNVEAIFQCGIPRDVPIVSTFFGSSDDEALECLYRQRRATSAQDVWTIVLANTHTTGHTIPSERGFFGTVSDAWDYMRDFLGWSSPPS